MDAELTLYKKDTITGEYYTPDYSYFADNENEFELIEDEIDINSIENINAYKLPENEEDFRQIFEFCRLQYHKNTEIIDDLKQLNKEIKSIKEK